MIADLKSIKQVHNYLFFVFLFITNPRFGDNTSTLNTKIRWYGKVRYAGKVKDNIYFKYYCTLVLMFYGTGGSHPYLFSIPLDFYKHLTLTLWAMYPLEAEIFDKGFFSVFLEIITTNNIWWTFDDQTNYWIKFFYNCVFTFELMYNYIAQLCV